MKQWIDKLRQERTLSPEELRQLLTGCDAETLRYINKQAQEVALRHFGNKIYIRGLIEVSNCCRNNCYYCGIRKGNPNIERYRLNLESILDCCRQGYKLGFRTFVLQGGEDPALTDDRIEMTVARIRQDYPDCAITLSLGEKSRDAYERFFRAGANRYLLRHETYNESHYWQLHPAEMSGKQRLQCLADLKDIGYQTGTGIMVGSPGQTVEHIIEDILFIEKLQPEMIGIGPFLPHHDTPFAQYPSGTVERTILLLSIFRLLLAHTTQEAALAQTGYQGNTEPLCNYFFMSASTVVITAIVYWITQKWLLPTLGKYEGSVKVVAYHPLSRKERRAIMISIVVAAVYVALILWLTFSSYGILRGVNGGLMHSPFIAGILFLLSLGAGITGMAYGFSSGRYRTDNDVIEGLTQPMKLLGVYFVIAFFAAQMFACFEYSHLDKCLAIMGADLLSSFEPAPLSALILFILFTALINLIMVSATSKWAFMSFIFIPMFAQMGIAPDVAQCAFRIGDSSTNAITPFLFYMPLVLTYMRQYDKQITYGSLLKYTWRYSLGILVAWTLMFIVWYLLKIPMGL